MTDARKVLWLAPLVTFAIVLVGLLLLAPPAEATITGTPLPASGDDWVIDTNTTVLGENIELNGSMIVQSPFTVTMKNTVMVIESAYPGEHGIWVLDSGADPGHLDMTEVTVRAKVSTAGWYFNIEGSANLHGSVRLSNVQDGIRIATPHDVTLDSVKLQAQGQYGIYIVSSAPTIVNCEVSNENDVTGSWDGRYSRPDYAWGIYVYGTSSMRSSPDISNTSVKVKLIDTWTHDTTYTSVYEYIYCYGLDAVYSDLGTLSRVTVSFDVEVKAVINITTSTEYLYTYMYVYGIRLQSGVVLEGFEDVVVDTSKYDINVNANGVTSGYMYDYFYFYGVYNQISSPGSCPSTITGLTLRGHHITYNGNNIFGTTYQYHNGRGIYWQPSTTAPAGGYVFEGVVLDGLDVQYIFELRNSWDVTFRNCTITDCSVGSPNTSGYVLYLSSWQYFVTLENSTIKGNRHSSGYMFYLYYMYKGFAIRGNTITDNTVSYFAYVYQLQSAATAVVEDNLFANNTFTAYNWYIYYAYGLMSIENNVFTNNQWNSYFMYNYYLRNEFSFSNNVITGNRWNTYFVYAYYMYAPFTMEGNEYSDNTGSTWWMYVYYMQSTGAFYFERNLVVNNTLPGGFYVYSNYGPMNVRENKFVGNKFTGSGMWMFYFYYNRNEYVVTDNTFEFNTYMEHAFRFYYFGYYATSPLTFERNQFIGNKGNSMNDNVGLVQFEYTRNDVTLSDNRFEGNLMNCIVNYNNYPDYSYWFTVEGNTFINNSGKCIIGYELDNMNFLVRSNMGTLNADYGVYLMQTSTTKNGPDVIQVELNNFTGNSGGGIYLRGCAYDSKYGTSYGNPTQEVLVRNNILTNNGQKGWALAILGVYRDPTPKGNDLSGSAMGYLLGLINDDPRREPFSVTYRDLVMDGGANGVSAFGFEGIDAEFFYCSLLNFSKALYAKDCTVNVWWSAIPEASGWTEGRGRIYVYNHVDFLVTWADATGEESGIPVNGATVALQGANSKYLNPFRTDVYGRYGPVVINPWVCIDGRMDALAPFDATVNYGGVSTFQKAHVVGELLMPDNPLHLVLVDNRIPEVIISNPQDATLLNSPDVLVEGFLFEVGSGVVVFSAQTGEMGEDDWDDVTPDTLWGYTFNALAEGAHTIRVRARDLAGNWNTTAIDFVIDLTPPTLTTWLENKDTTLITGPPYFTRSSEIIINGTYSDDHATLAEVTIRINGVRFAVPDKELGRIFKFQDLTQGLNIIIIDATDTAGNSVTMEIHVTLDRYGPVLYLQRPLQGEATSSTKMTLVGLTEPNKLVSVTIVAVAGSINRETTSKVDGTFTMEVDLFEGYQRVIVSVVDEAGNEALITRDVLRDTTPPEFQLTSPAPGEQVVTNSVKYTIRGRMTQEPDAKLLINGQEVPNPGVFERTLVLQEGDNMVEIVAIDKVGNRNEVTIIIVRDTVKPGLEVLSPGGTSLLTRVSTISFAGTSFTADRTAGGVVVEHRGIDTPATLVTGSWDGTAEWECDINLLSTDLDQYITVKAIDRAGNVASWAIHVVYDVIPPALSIDAIPGTVTVPSVRIAGTTDETVDYVYIQGVPYRTSEGTFSVTWSLTAGENIIVVEVRDEAGNVQSETLQTFYDYKEYEPRDTTVDEEDNSLYLWSVIIIVVAVTVISTTANFYVQRKRRR